MEQTAQSTCRDAGVPRLSQMTGSRDVGKAASPQEVSHPKLLVKRCTCCGEVKPLTDFYTNNKTKDGHQSQCKACNAKSTHEARKRRIEKQKTERLRTELSQFTPRELMQELANRGYKGSLQYVETHIINIEKL